MRGVCGLVAAVMVGAGAVAPPPALARGPDLFVQVAQLTGAKGPSTGAIPPSSNPADTFGTSVAVSANGHVLAVGAPAVARIYVYVRPAGGRWKDAHQTAALDGFTNSDSLGSSVAVSNDGSTIVAGAPSENGGAGAVYVYVEPPGGWKHASVLPTMMLRARDSTGEDNLGASVAVSANGSTILAGAPDGAASRARSICSPVPIEAGARRIRLGACANVGEPGGNSSVRPRRPFSGAAVQCTPLTGVEVCTVSFSAPSPGTYSLIASYPGDARRARPSDHAKVLVTT